MQLVTTNNDIMTSLMTVIRPFAKHRKRVKKKQSSSQKTKNYNKNKNKT